MSGSVGRLGEANIPRSKGTTSTARSTSRTSTSRRALSTRAGASLSSSARPSLLPSPSPCAPCRPPRARRRRDVQGRVRDVAASVRGRRRDALRDRGEQMLAGKEKTSSASATASPRRTFISLPRSSDSTPCTPATSSLRHPQRLLCDRLVSNAALFLCDVSVGSERARAREGAGRCRWSQKLYWFNDAFSSTCNFEHIKTRCHSSRPRVRPHSS